MGNKPKGNKPKGNKTNKGKAFEKYKQMERAQIRKEKNIWTWFIFVPPVGLYKSFKYKALPKAVNIFILILMLTISFLCVDMLIYPNRVIDGNIESYIEKSEGLGKVREIQSAGTVDDKYIIYNVITTKGIYDVYVSDNTGREVSAIQQTAPEQKLIVDNGFDVIDKNAHSEILKFFNTEDKFGELKEVLETVEEGQVVKTTKGVYKFHIKYQQVIQIDENKEGVYEKVYGKDPVINIPDKLQKILDKRVDTLGNLEKVVSMAVNESHIDYIIEMDTKKLHKVRFELDGTVVIYNQD